MARDRRFHVVPWALAVLCSSSLHAQATVTGTVTDRATGLPLADAQVFVGTRTVPAITNAVGKYRLEGVPGGRAWVMVRRIGYAPARRSMLVRGDSVHTLHVGLDPLPVTLPEIEVRAQSGYGVRHLQDFWHRYSTAWGRFVTRDEIERSGPWLSTLVKMYLPFRPVDHWDVDAYYAAQTNGFDNLSMTTPNGVVARNCPPAISVDGGIPWQGNRYVDDYPPSAVEAMEIYKPGQRVPIEFQFYGQSVGCGLVVLWLR